MDSDYGEMIYEYEYQICMLKKKENIRFLHNLIIDMVNNFSKINNDTKILLYDKMIQKIKMVKQMDNKPIDDEIHIYI